MVLSGAEYNCLFFLVNLVQKYFNTFSFTFFNHNNFVEIRFNIDFSLFNFTFNNLIIGCIEIIVKVVFILFTLKGVRNPSFMPSLRNKHKPVRQSIYKYQHFRCVWVWR